MTPQKDALGNLISIGEIYGYSNRANGIVTVIVGKVVGFTEKFVSLSVIHRGKAVYENEICEDTPNERPVSVIGNVLFPLASSSVLWLEKI